MTFRFVDLFAGVGGFHEALAGLGGECVLASEIDPACQEVYRRRFPTANLVGDIRELTGVGAARVPEHDVLCAGFPCQPFSKSGFQLGLEDRTRGTLFHEIMKIVRARHPNFLILENVRNLAGPRHASTWQIIIDSLRTEGYRVASEPTIFSPHLLPKHSGGRPQVRERVFILAEHLGKTSLVSERIGDVLVPNAPIGSWSPAQWNIDDWLTPDDQISDLKRYKLRENEIEWLEAWQDFIQSVDEPSLPGFPIWSDEFRDYPNIDEGTPAWKARCLARNSELYRRNRSAIDDWRRRHHLDHFPPSRRKFEWQAGDADRDLWKLVMHLRPSGIRVKRPSYLPALVAITQTSVIGARRRRITPREAARLQGFPDDFPLHPNDATAYKQLGNAVNVGVVRYLARRLLAGSRAHRTGALEAAS